jgi:hypothetical protein
MMVDKIKSRAMRKILEDAYDELGSMRDELSPYAHAFTDAPVHYAMYSAYEDIMRARANLHVVLRYGME